MTPPPDLTTPSAIAIRDGAVFSEIVRQLSATRALIAWLHSQPLGREIHMPQVERAFKDLVSALKHATPHAACPYEPNCADGQCRACKGSHWITKGVYDALPKELR